MLSLSTNPHHGVGLAMPVEGATEEQTARVDRLDPLNSRVTPSRRADTAGGEVSLLRPVASTPSFRNTAATAYELFRLGWSTDRIATYWNISEAEAERLVFEQRCTPKGRKPRLKIYDRERLLDLLDVDPATGEIRWRERPDDAIWNKRFAGKQAGGKNSQGYVVVNIRNTHHRAHHIVWTVANGVWPHLDIDHIDGDRANNRISNLRQVTRVENLRNKGAASGRVGLVGVTKSGRQWRARIYVDREQIELGYFDHFEDAIAARHSAEKKFGFSKDHGRRCAHGHL